MSYAPLGSWWTDSDGYAHPDDYVNIWRKGNEARQYIPYRKVYTTNNRHRFNIGSYAKAAADEIAETAIDALPGGPRTKRVVRKFKNNLFRSQFSREKESMPPPMRGGRKFGATRLVSKSRGRRRSSRSRFTPRYSRSRPRFTPRPYRRRPFFNSYARRRFVRRYRKKRRRYY